MSTRMNSKMIGILMRKDFSLMRVPVLAYTLIGMLSVAVMGSEMEGLRYGGIVLLITALMGLSMHPPMATTVTERKEMTLPFVMSLPISPRDFTCAKLLVNLAMFFIPWTLLLGATLATIAMRPNLPDGLIPVATILFGVLGVAGIAILGVAIVTESMQWAIATQLASNLIFQAVMYSASHTASIKASMYGDTPVWNDDVLTFIGAEIAVAAIWFAFTLWRQARKTDFL